MNDNDSRFMRKKLEDVLLLESDANWYFNSKFCHQKTTRALLVNNDLTIDLLWDMTFWRQVALSRRNP